MGTRITPVTLGRVSIFSAVILGSALLISSPSAPFTTRDKAFYMDEKEASFVRPGLVITITKGEIATDGTMKATFKLTDPKGQPLDRTGAVTPGAVSVSFIAATIPNGSDEYQAYTTRVQTTPANSPRPGQSAIQATGQNNGTFREITMGEYEYTFSTKAPANLDRSATHTFGAYGSRNLTAAATGLADDLGTQYDDDTFNFVPDGSAVKTVRDVIRSETCNNCHTQLAFHGGSRRSMPVCVLCHTDRTFGSTPGASNIDPDTGESIDLRVMAHRIHMGADLPSVKAGKPYVIVGNAQSMNDYSEISFPFGSTSRTGGHMVDCNGCHGKDSAVQKDNWLTKPSRAACGACHDNVNFATGQGHVNLPQLSDNQCSTCHTAQGEVEFDASIKGAHSMPRFSPSLPGTTIQILNVANGTAGNKPTVTFSVKDKGGNAIPANKLETLRVYYAGPTTDYAGFVQEDARNAQCDPNGVCNWTFARAIPADAKGTFSAYIEGYRTIKILEGTTKEASQRDVAVNPQFYFSVDGSPVAPRKQVVSMQKCNACHGYLAFHGDQRNTLENCLNCHNANQTDVARRPANQLPAQSVDFKTMIHRLHSGKEMGEHEYTVYGFGNVANDLTEFGFPGDLRNCDGCHVNNSQQLPLRKGMLPVQDARQDIPVVLPETAACTSCHTSTFAKSHALANTTQLGESCATCHGPNADFAVSKVHAH